MRNFSAASDGECKTLQLFNNHPVRPQRHRTCLNGKLVFGADALTPDNPYTLDCTIRDISDGGARVTLGNHQPLPLELYLIVVRNCAAHQVQVVWRRFPARGLKFLKTYALDAGLPEELKYLRRLWLELDVRFGGVEQ